MTNKHPRKVYLRKKGDSYCYECKIKGRTVLLWTLPKDSELFIKKLCESSFFPKDKSSRILTILASSDYKTIFPKKNQKEVRTIKIIGSQENDGDDEEEFDLDDEITELKDRFLPF